MYLPKTALLSTRQSTPPLLRFAQALDSRGWGLHATSGTARFLEENGLPVTDIAKWVGRPILESRMVTLSREVHAALQARLGNLNDLAALQNFDIEPLGLVYVDMSAPKEALGDMDQVLAGIEKMDIGGPAMLLSAVKGRRIVLSEEDQFLSALVFIDTHDKVNKEEKEKRLLRFASEALINIGTRFVNIGTSVWKIQQEDARRPFP